MEPSTPLFSDLTLEIFDDFSHNPFVVRTAKAGPNSTSTDSSAGYLDNCKSSNTATTTTTTSAHADPYNNNNSNNNNNNTTTARSYWDVIISDDQLAATAAAAGLDLTPELSPSMSICSPAFNEVNSPYGFDSVGFDDFIPSPSVFDSPYEQSIGGEHVAERSFDFDFDFRMDMSQMTDFQLFPDCTTESTSLKKLLMMPAPAETELMTTTESPAESRLNCVPTSVCESISPAALEYFPDSFSTAKILGQDVIAPMENVAPRKPVQSPTKPGFQPNKKRRRRRITTEDACRVVPEDDPNGKARYQCSECLKTFSRPFNLRSHRTIHLGLKPHACTHVDKKGVVCHWSFARRHDLERHMRSRHLTKETITCKTCGVTCTRSDAMLRHLAKNEACEIAASELDDQDMDQVSHL
ncbi:hypothetical protein BGZ54_006051 [Gamsiella multidivaricata]|nr:hypothetical protein BGZ54_006051 [Gamsiella multidivaricata]